MSQKIFSRYFGRTQYQMKNSGALAMRHASNNKLSVGNGSGLDIFFGKVHSHRKPGPKLESSRTTEERKANDDLEEDSDRKTESRQNMEGKALAQNRVCWRRFVEAGQE
jgi:hypothetical protein